VASVSSAISVSKILKTAAPVASPVVGDSAESLVLEVLVQH